MLPQKISLDILINEQNEEVTVEINGIDSGYNGMIGTKDDPSEKITHIIGKALRNKYVAKSARQFELSKQFANREKILKEEYNISVEERSLLYPKTRYSAYFGFLKSYSEGIDDNDMINSLAVESVTKHKLLQYELLNDITNLRMPKTTWILLADFNKKNIEDTFLNQEKMVQKDPQSMCGIGIEINTKEQLEENIELNKSYFSKRMNRLGLRNEDFNLDVFNKIFTDWKEEYPQLYDYHFKNIIHNSAAIFQPFVRSKPIINSRTNEKHHARARIIWFGEYVGGYWALSKNPIESYDRNNAIVNYHTSQIAQPFTTEDNERFKVYANEICPKIITRLTKFNNKREIYDDFLNYARFKVLTQGIYNSTKSNLI